MTVTVPDDVEKMIAALIESGAYQSTDDVLRAAVRVLDQHAERGRKTEELRKPLQESVYQIGRGQIHDGEDVFAELLGDGETEPESEGGERRY